MTKNIIITILIIIALVIAYLYFVSQKQDATLSNISSVTTSDESDAINVNPPQGDVILLSKTSAGLIQPNASFDKVMIDTEKTFITFTGYKIGGEHTGSFETMQAELVIQDQSIKGGSITIDATSVKTDTAAVDTHLQSADFFDVEKYATITFLANEIVSNDADQTALLNGSLTFHGVTKNISVPLTIIANGVAADFKISMADFGISYPATKDEVRVQAQIVLK